MAAAWVAYDSRCVTLFQLITMVGWSDISMKVQDSTGWYAAIYFVLVIVFGQFVILNLIIAVLGESYQDAIEEADSAAREKREEAQQLRLAKKEAKRLKKEAREVIEKAKLEGAKLEETQRHLQGLAAEADADADADGGAGSGDVSPATQGGLGRRSDGSDAADAAEGAALHRRDALLPQKARRR